MEDDKQARDEHDVQKLQALLAQRNRELASVREQHHEVARILTQVVSSKSWYLTEPLRRIDALIQSLLRFVRGLGRRRPVDMPHAGAAAREPSHSPAPHTAVVQATMATMPSERTRPTTVAPLHAAHESKALVAFANRFSALYGHAPIILDWTRAQTLASQYRELTIFSPPARVHCLPYADHSVDVVILSDDAPELGAEAARVASIAVVQLAPTSDIAPTELWLREAPADPLPSCSLVICAYNQWPLTAACLTALEATLPPAWLGEIIVVDDASSDETPQRLRERAERLPYLRVLRHEKNRGFLDSANDGAEAASGEFLVFLNNDTRALPGWLPPLLRTFAQFPDAGAVGGKLLFPDGRLQEAGGIVFRDASAAHYGRYEPDPEALLFNYVRAVHYCSGALLATRRSVFSELGGFDVAFRPGYYEDADYCFRLRESGRRVYYQPRAAAIHLEGGTAGSDVSVGMKRFQAINSHHFYERWRRQLLSHPDPNLRAHPNVWYVLAHRGEEA